MRAGALVDDDAQLTNDHHAGRTHYRTAHALLVVVCVLYVLVVVWRTSQRFPLTWDEVVYASQVARDVPAAMFSAPRSRGMSILLAPVTVWTSAVLPFRIYLTLGSGLLMYLAYRPWLAVLARYGVPVVYVAPFAAALFGTLWLTTLYGTMAYPNLWLAFVLVSGAGFFFLAVRKPTLWLLVAIAGAFAVASLLRPTDALATAAPLIVAAGFVRSWRWLRPLVATLTGLAVGWLAWIVEAYVRFSGPLTRLRDGAEINEGGLTWSLPKYLDALDGPRLLCRPPSACEGVALISAAWWFALPLLAAAGLYAAYKHRWSSAAIVTASGAVTLALPYMVLFDYAAPRFLLPSYALLALLVAAGLMMFVELARGYARGVAGVLIGVLVVGHVTVQQDVFADANDLVVSTGRSHTAQAAMLRDDHGVRPPCVLVGEGVIQIAYILKCRSIYVPPGEPLDAGAIIEESARAHETVVFKLDPATPVPSPLRSWEQIDLPVTSFLAYVSP